MHFYQSLLSRKESTALKGVLILLVVLGHNAILMEQTGLFPYIYSFHVYCFYILPFVYGMKWFEEGKPTHVLFQCLLRDVKAYYPLYIIWSIFSLIITQVLRHSSVNFSNLLSALILGNGQLREYCGSAFLWFLPTIVAVLFWKNLYFLMSKNGKLVLFFITILVWGLAIFGILDYRTPGDYIPFSLYSGLAFSFSGILTRWLLEHMPDVKWKVFLFPPIFAIVPIFVRFRSSFPVGCTYLSWSVMPVIAFVALAQLKRVLAQNKCLLFLGRHSLELYLVHVFVFNGISRVFRQPSLTSGIVIYLLTLLISLGFILFVERTPLKCVLIGFNKDFHSEKCQSNRKF